MAIRKYLILLPLLLMLVACEKLERPLYSNKYGQFVRFNLQVTNDGEPIKPGEVNPAASAVSYFAQKTVQSLAIPVTITSEPLENRVEVYFSFDTIGPFSDFTVSPKEVLSFNGTQLTDTIYLTYQGRWDGTSQNQIIFTLDSVSHDSIHLGNLNSIEKNTTLTVNLEELNLRYNFPTANAVEILGELGETMLIKVEFPDGFFSGEVEGRELIIRDFQDFKYSLEQQPYMDGDLQIAYLFTLDQALDDDLQTFRAGFTLDTLANYHLAGNSTFSITKPENIPRDVSLNTAAHFYDIDDKLYRTYGELWFDSNKNDTCSWGYFFQFTYPVVVNRDHPNAILADNMGTIDPNDDVYHHAFRIGFNTPNAGRTTNSFNLKRWFENAYTDEDKSPGFNIPQALEFFPDNEGTSATSGIVKVIEQDLIITGKLGDGLYVTHTISIEGEGTYYEISDGIFEISLELRATNMDLFGGTQTAHYRIYNTDTYMEPAPLEIGCFKPIEL